MSITSKILIKGVKLAFRELPTQLLKQTGYSFDGKQITLTTNPGAKPRPDHKGSAWPDSKKIEVATVYAVLQDIEATCKVTKMYPYVIKKWVNEVWFIALVNKVKRDKNELLDGKITEVLSQAMDLILDRIQNGEVVYDRKGNMSRVPMRARDATYVFDALFSKRQLIRGEATSRVESISQDEKLDKLKTKFEQLAQSKGINANSEVIEHEPTQIPGEGSEAGTEAQGTLQEGGEPETGEDPRRE